jgi:hypothetical protein
MLYAREDYPKLDWVFGTIQKMNALGADSREEWKKAWLRTYEELGGTSKLTGTKECPMSAAFGLWYLGYVKNGGRARLQWSRQEVKSELGENAVYAVIAVNLLESWGKITPTELWSKMRECYWQEKLGRPRQSQQGVASLTIRLYESDNVIA